MKLIEEYKYFWKVFINIFNTPLLWRTILLEWDGIGFKYLLNVIAHISILFVLLFTPIYFLLEASIEEIINNRPITPLAIMGRTIIDNFPEIEINDGEMVTEFKEPYIIKNFGKDYNIMVITSNPKYKFNHDNYIFIIDKYGLFSNSSFGPQMLLDFAKFKEHDRLVNSEDLLHMTEAVNHVLAKSFLLIIPLLIPIVMVMSFMSVFVGNVIATSIAWLFMGFKQYNIRWRDLFRLTNYIFTPSYLIVMSLALIFIYLDSQVTILIFNNYNLIALPVTLFYLYQASKTIRKVR